MNHTSKSDDYFLNNCHLWKLQILYFLDNSKDLIVLLDFDQGLDDSLLQYVIWMFRKFTIEAGINQYFHCNLGCHTIINLQNHATCYFVTKNHLRKYDKYPKNVRQCLLTEKAELDLWNPWV